MKTFEQLLENANSVSDARSKAYVELKKNAPAILQSFATAMINLGFSSYFFGEKILVDQESFHSYAHYCESYGFRIVKNGIEVAIEEEMNNFGDLVNVYGEVVPFSEASFNGRALLNVLESLPERLASLTEKANEELERIKSVLG